METWSDGSSLTEVRGGGTNLHPQDQNTTLDDNLFSMNGPMIYKMARKKVYDRIKNDLKRNNLTQNDIDLLIPHQASGLAVKAYSKYGGFKKNKVMDIIDFTGNCVAASIPLALSLAYNNNQINREDLLYFVGTGAGLSIGSLILKF
jgi:3-oxoacyl-[acyl-carrier-protein] synthase-3